MRPGGAQSAASLSRARAVAAGLTSAALMLGTACSGSSSGGHAAASTGSGTTPVRQTITVGVLTDLTGPAAVLGRTTEEGIKAGVGFARQQGYDIKYYLADTGSTPSGALTGARALVQQHRVFAVVLLSQLGFAASTYLTQQGIPVVGANGDGPEWLHSRNMFSILGFGDYARVITTHGHIFEALGGKVFGGIGYGIEPSSYEVVKSAAESARMAGLRVGYVNTHLPFGTTDLGPVAIAMKNAGVDVVYPGLAQATSFALIKALQQQGVKFKAVLPAGYGGDLTGGGPGASQVAQGQYFQLGFEPVELNTPATRRFADAVARYAGRRGEPTLSDYLGYLSIDGIVTGLKASGQDQPSRAAFIDKMLTIRNYNGQGLYGGHTFSFALQGRGSVVGADNCSWIVRYVGTTFVPVPKMQPICGTTTGETVSGQ